MKRIRQTSDEHVSDDGRPGGRARRASAARIDVETVELDEEIDLDAWAERYVKNVLEAEGITVARPAPVRRIGS